MGIVLCVKSERHVTYFDGNASVTTDPFATGRFEGEGRGEGVKGERRGGWPPFCGFLRDVSGVRALSRTRGHETANLSLRKYSNTHMHTQVRLKRNQLIWFSSLSSS